MTEILDFEQANRLLMEGKKEDAYSAFLSIVSVCTEQLQQARFSHQYLINRTRAYEDSIECIRKSADGLEKILAPKPKPPVPPKIQTTNLKRCRGNSTSLVDDDDDEEDEADLVAEFLKLPPRTRSPRVTLDDLLLETVIDVSKLGPAQTPMEESLSVPSRQADAVPLIPVPPLLTLYRQLGQESRWLQKVRSLYMSAMTIPSVMEFRVGVLAYQLTLIESALFRAIPPDALKTHTIRTPQPRMVASTDFFNFLTRTIEHSILLPPECGRRAEILNRWIKVASKLWVLSNYQTLKAVVSALGTPPIQRLRRTWECIPKKQIHRLETMQQLMSETDNYSQYRQRTPEDARPAIPFLGVFIHDMTYLVAANKPCKPVLDAMSRFQQLPAYPHQPPPSFVIKKHLFRPTSSQSNKAGTTTCILAKDENASEETMIGLEQQLVMQYILMRPWVPEKTIDMLSQLREPAKRPASATSPTLRWDDDEKKLGFWPFRKSQTQTTIELPSSPIEPKKSLHHRSSSPIEPKKSLHHRSSSLPSKVLLDITH